MAITRTIREQLYYNVKWGFRFIKAIRKTDTDRSRHFVFTPLDRSNIHYDIVDSNTSRPLRRAQSLRRYLRNKYYAVGYESKSDVIPLSGDVSDGLVDQERHVPEVGAETVAPPRVVVQVDGLELGALFERAVFDRDQTVAGQPDLGEVGRVAELARDQVRYATVAEVQHVQVRRVEAAGQQHLQRVVGQVEPGERLEPGERPVLHQMDRTVVQVQLAQRPRPEHVHLRDEVVRQPQRAQLRQRVHERFPRDLGDHVPGQVQDDERRHAVERQRVHLRGRPEEHNNALVIVVVAGGRGNGKLKTNETADV